MNIPPNPLLLTIEIPTLGPAELWPFDDADFTREANVDDTTELIATPPFRRAEKN